MLLDMGGSRTLQRWIAFFGLAPWGARREDERASVVALTVARGTLTRKDKRGHRLEDFGLVRPPKGTPTGGGWRDWRQAKAAVMAAFGKG